MPKEQSKVEQPKKEKKRPQHEVELEERRGPQKKEDLDKWAKRIGGPYVKIVKDLEKYSPPEKKEKKNWPLRIDSEATLILNDENIAEYFGKKDTEKIVEWAKKENSGVTFNKSRKEYKMEKEILGGLDVYLGFIADSLENKKGMVIDERFHESIIEWAKELEKKKAETKAEKKPKKKPEKPKSKKKPKEKKEKEPTLNEKIDKKRKEIEEIERGYNIYYSRAVQDLLGLYYKERYKKDLKGLKKELEELEKKGVEVGVAEVKEVEEVKEVKEPGIPEEKKISKHFRKTRVYFERRKLEKEAIERYLNHLRYTEDIFQRMVKLKKETKRKDLDPETQKIKETAYMIARKEWGDACEKTGELYEDLGEKSKKKVTKKREKERRPDLSWWEFLTKKFGKKTISEVTRDATKGQLKVIEKRLKEIPNQIKKIGVIGRADLEKEQGRLEKKLKKLK